MSISAHYMNAFSVETEKVLLPVKRLLDSDCLLRTVEVDIRFKVNNVEKSSYYFANPYNESPFRYVENDFRNILLCYHRAMGAVTRQGKDVHLLQIALTVTYEDENELVKKITTVLGRKFATYDLEHKTA